MQKIMINEIGEEAERRRLDAWCQKHKITTEAQAELSTILYGKQTLHKGDAP